MNTLEQLDTLKEQIAKQNDPSKLTVTNSILVPVLENLGAVASLLGAIGAGVFLSTGIKPWDSYWFMEFLWPIAILVFFILMFLRFTKPERTIAKYFYYLIKLAIGKRKVEQQKPIEPIIVQPKASSNTRVADIKTAILHFYNGGSVTRDALIEKLGTKKQALTTIADLERMGIYRAGARSETPKLLPNTYEDAAKIAIEFYKNNNDSL